MTRINVTATDSITGEFELVGWFDPDKATEYAEDTDWDGSNNVSVNPVGEFGHQSLYRTAGGRWVLHTWSQWQGVAPVFEFVDDERAREWLLLNKEDAAAAELGPVEDERGPGRREVGNAVHVRLGDLLAEVDRYAEAHGQARAEAIRALIAAGLAEQPAGVK